MKRVAMFIAVICLLTVPVFAAPVDENATAPVMTKPTEPSKSTQDPGTSTSIVDKLPMDIVSKGSDPSGTLLSYKLKEELIASKLFVLTPVEKKKFVLQVRTQSEFPDRPGIASQYSIALVYQEDASTLSYYLDQIQGQVHGEGVTAEIQKILEWSYATLKRYHYLLDE
jgi:hypothetical protein